MGERRRGGGLRLCRWEGVDKCEGYSRSRHWERKQEADRNERVVEEAYVTGALASDVWTPKKR